MRIEILFVIEFLFVVLDIDSVIFSQKQTANEILFLNIKKKFKFQKNKQKHININN